MQEFMGNKDNICPKAKRSSLHFSAPSPTPCSSIEPRNNVTAPRCSEGFTDTPQLKRHRLTPRGEMLKWVKVYTQSEEQKEKERREILERYLLETMNFLKETMDFFKTYLPKP